MSRRTDIEKHRHSLDEIRNIMNAIKNLSYMETHKIDSFLDAQHNVVKNIETVASDFLCFYPETLTKIEDVPVEIYLLIGSERGFCGDFNHALLRYFEKMSITADIDRLRIITVGQKLKTLMEDEAREIISIQGPGVAEEVDAVIYHIVDQLDRIQAQYASMNLQVIYQDEEFKIRQQQILPPFQNLLQQEESLGFEPELNLAPEKFMLDLGSQFLSLILNEIIYTSLLAENRLRVAHLEGAVQRMDDQSEDLQRQSNVLRQEEIIEEIEVILLNTAGIHE